MICVYCNCDVLDLYSKFVWLCIVAAWCRCCAGLSHMPYIGWVSRFLTDLVNRRCFGISQQLATCWCKFFCWVWSSTRSLTFLKVQTFQKQARVFVAGGIGVKFKMKVEHFWRGKICGSLFILNPEQAKQVLFGYWWWNVSARYLVVTHDLELSNWNQDPQTCVSIQKNWQNDCPGFRAHNNFIGGGCNHAFTLGDMIQFDE